MYDATGVRLHAGKQASILNMIITELPPDHPVSANGSPLKDTLGHTPLQARTFAVLLLHCEPWHASTVAQEDWISESLTKETCLAVCRWR